MKKCTICKLDKDLELFSKNCRTQDGHSWRCKKCDCEYQKRYQLANAEAVKKQKAAYYKENAEAKRLKSRERYTKNPELVKAQHASSVKKHKERVTKYKHEWYEKNKVRLAEESKKRYAALSEEKRAVYASQAAKRKRDNPIGRAANEAARRARKRQAGGTHTAADVEKLLVSQKYKCIVCRSSLVKKHHVDHIVALSNGGDNSVFNLQVLCPRCNLKKRSRDPVEFMQSNGFLL